MKVLKFGGTSVGSARRIKEVAKLINDGERKIVVLSAMSGTTNSLVEIAEEFKQQHPREAIEKISRLQQKHIETVGQLLKNKDLKDKALSLVDVTFKHLRSFSEKKCGHKEENDILAQGELLSTHFMCYHLSEIGISNAWLPALEYMRTDENAEPDMLFIKENIQKQLAQHPNAEIFITQGFICKNANDEIDNLQRGGSDYTATLLGAATGATEIQIWTDIDGMHNNDPRFVEDTRPIAQLSFDEAAELAYFGAKILHPTCVRPAKEAQVPVKLLNTMKPEAKGTTISAEVKRGRVAAIAAKDGITAIKIKSGRMLQAYGFLRKIFEIFEEHQTAIDMITTSEVGVSLTIDDDSALSVITEELRKWGDVTIDKGQTIICIAGDFTPGNLKFAGKVTDALKNMDVRMISYGGSKYNISVLINEVDKKKALKLLSDKLFR